MSIIACLRSLLKEILGNNGRRRTKCDIHTRLMKQNYDSIPQWWFLSILFAMIALAMLTVQVFGEQLQLPYWGILLGCALVLIFILPIGVIQATTNENLILSVVPELLIGYLYPGKPAATIAFNSYSLMSLYQALLFLSDFKFGHYMKVAPKSMFIVQVVATIISCSVSFVTEWWLFSRAENPCDPVKLSKESPWTCPGENVIHSMFNVWGLIGPARIFAPHGIYSSLYFFFLLGVVVTALTWSLCQKFPQKLWLQHINVPIILGVARNILAFRPVNYWTWLLIGFFFNVVVFRNFKWWWKRYNYVLSSGLDAGVAFMVFLTSVLQFQGMYWIKEWATAGDQCPLAKCPTAPGVIIKGCPIFHR